MTNQEAIRILNEQRNKFMDEWVDFGGVNEAYNMAINLLKEQEAVPYKRDVNEHGQVISCGNCGAWFIVQYQKYCHECGQAVKWDDSD